MLLIKQPKDQIKRLRKQGNLSKMHISVIKSYAKRLGLDILKIRGRNNLEVALRQLLKNGLTFMESKAGVILHLITLILKITTDIFM